MKKMDEKDVNLLFVGDTHISKKENIVLGDKIKELISSSDVVSCNFEGPIKKRKLKSLPKAGPNLCQDKYAIKKLKKLGFNFFNLSNNHIMDYGKTGLKDTINELDKEKLDYIGAGDFSDAYSLKIKKIKGKKIGFLSFAEWGFGVIEKEGEKGFSWINHSIVDNLIKESKKKVDFLIVQIHAGEEEIFLPQPEWREKYKEIVDLGADVIVGHHPHVPQPIEKYKKKLIVYSLGNFYFNKFQERSNYILKLKISNKIGYEIFPIIQKGNIVEIQENNNFIKHIKKYFSNNNQKKYNEGYKKVAKKRYDDVYKKYFNEKKIYRIIKNFIKTILRKKVDSQKLIKEHFKKRESHYYIINKFNKNYFK